MKLQNGLKISSNEQEWNTIEDQTYTRTILHALGDDDKKNILMTLTTNPKTINEVLTKSNIPKTSGYRKINSLINDGLIVADGFSYNDDNKRIISYVSIFSDLKIDFIKNKMTVKIRPNKNLENT